MSATAAPTARCKSGVPSIRKTVVRVTPTIAEPIISRARDLGMGLQCIESDGESQEAERTEPENNEPSKTLFAVVQSECSSKMKAP